MHAGTLEIFLRAQINSGLALVHTAMAFAKGSESRVRHQLLAEYRYRRVLWFLSRVDLPQETHTDVLDALTHLQRAIETCHSDEGDSSQGVLAGRSERAGKSRVPRP